MTKTETRKRIAELRRDIKGHEKALADGRPLRSVWYGTAVITFDRTDELRGMRRELRKLEAEVKA